ASTIPTSYQPAYGAAPGYDLATGLGSVNALNLACSSAWTTSVITCSTTAVSSSLNPSTAGTAVTFTATITGNSPTGTVTWSANTGCIASAVSGGVATCTSSSLAVGTDVITAVYSGDSHNIGSSGTLSGGQVVGTATAGVSVACLPVTSNYGQSVT